MHAHRHIILANRSIPLDEEGFLMDVHDWSPQVAEHFALTDGLQLDDEHWIVLRFARDYYKTFCISPMPKIIVKGLNRQTQSEQYNVKKLYALFPDTPARRICKYAGIPQPAGCT